MEIKYTNFDVDPKVFPKEQVYGIIDSSSNYVYENIYGVERISLPKFSSAKRFLQQKTTDKKLLESLIEEFEFSKELLKKQVRSLSSSELEKMMFLKVLLSDAKTILLDNIDMVLNYRDLLLILKTSQKYAAKCSKKIIYTTCSPDNLLKHIDHYIVIENELITYSGKDIRKLPVDTELKSFVDKANKKGAKLDYYKDINDLLKAIYRSVK